jgi:aminoglycoside phosphotransferase (APT) family kinase protein
MEPNEQRTATRESSGGSGSTAVGTLSEQLRAVVADSLSESAVEIADLRRLTGGASRETWSFRALLGDGTSRALILRRDPPTAARTEGEMSREATAIEAAARAGVSEPELLAYSDDPSFVDAPFIVMSHIDGETVARRILRDAEYDDVRPRLAERCGETLARIHSIPPQEVAGLHAPDALERLRGDLDNFSDPSPAFELGMRWLEQNRPASGSVTVVHGDFRNGNLIIGPDDLRAVLDWELVHRGDPMEDLGYLCARCWRYGVVERPVGGFGDYADLFRGYERIAGTAVDPATVRWWELLSSVRWGASCMTQAWRHLSGRVRSVELAAVGRRVWEQEYDVLLYLREIERRS